MIAISRDAFQPAGLCGQIRLFCRGPGCQATDALMGTHWVGFPCMWPTFSPPQTASFTWAAKVANIAPHQRQQRLLATLWILAVVVPNKRRPVLADGFPITLHTSSQALPRSTNRRFGLLTCLLYQETAGQETKYPTQQTVSLKDTGLWVSYFVHSSINMPHDRYRVCAEDAWRCL